MHVIRLPWVTRVLAFIPSFIPPPPPAVHIPFFNEPWFYPTVLKRSPRVQYFTVN